MIKRLKNEDGYSLVEVMVAIMILAMAIIPMVGMFDSGLRAANTSGNYDKARSLANANLEAAKAMSFSQVKNLSTPSCIKQDAAFNCSFTRSSVRLSDTGNAGVKEFEEYSSADPSTLKVTFTVEWATNNRYSTSGVVAK